jgi:hypothetical protein
MQAEQLFTRPPSFYPPIRTFQRSNVQTFFQFSGLPSFHSSPLPTFQRANVQTFQRSRLPTFNLQFLDLQPIVFDPRKIKFKKQLGTNANPPSSAYFLPQMAVPEQEIG